MSSNDVTIFVFGAGPNMRSISQHLASELFPTARLLRFETLEGATARARRSGGPVLLLDARVAPGLSLVDLVGYPSPCGALAVAFDGKNAAVAAAYFAANGPALEQVIGRPVTADAPVIGSWMVPLDKPEISPGGPRVNLRSNGGGFTGYAAAARALMIGMAESGVDIRWCADWIEDDIADLPDEDLNIIRALGKKPQTNPDITIVHNTVTQRDGAPFLERYREIIVPSGPLVWATMFETDGIPARWVADLNRCDAVWVPCTHNLQSFANAGVQREKLCVVPIGLDVENYDIDGEEMDLPFRRGFNFLSVFEWRKRKGYDVLLKAYAQAFGPGDDVALYIRSSLPRKDIQQALRDAIAELGLDRSKMAPILFLPNKVPQKLLPSLYRAIDAFVLPSRGEAFGIPYAESLALGIPVIGTAFGGPLDFLNTQTGYPIPCTLSAVDREFAQDMPIYRGQRWAEPSVEATAAAMRTVFDNPQQARGKAAHGCALIRTQFNRQGAGKIGADALEKVPRHPVRPSFAAPKLKYVGVAASLAGYGSEARGFISALQRQGIGVELDMYNYENLDVELRPAESRLLKHSRTVGAPEGSPVIYHLLPHQVHELPEGRPAIIRTMEETDGLDTKWPASLARFDRIWVPSIFNAETFQRAGVDYRKIRVVPGTIDTSFWSPAIGGIEIPGTAGFRFLSVFDWMARKGWDLLLTAYMRAFSSDDDVSLTLKVTDLVSKAAGDETTAMSVLNEFAFKTFPEKARLKKTPRVLLLSQKLSEDHLARIYAGHHAFVGPSRAEGWGRGHMEAMACGLPTIGTRWGGNLAFMNDENSYLVDIEGLVEANADTARYFGRRWAQPSVEHLEQLLRRVFERQDEARRRGAIGRRSIVENFSLDAVGPILREQLEELTQFDFPVASTAKTMAREDVFIIVDAREHSRLLPGSLDRILRYTCSEATVAIVCHDAQGKNLQKRLAPHDGSYSLVSDLSTIAERAREFRYTAIVRSDVMVALGWDRLLILALQSQLRAGCAVPRFVGIGEQPPDPTDVLYNMTTMQHFDSYAMDRMIMANATGTYSLAFPPLCLIIESRLYAPPTPGLFPNTLPAAYQCWTAFDCLAHLAKENAS